MKTCSKCNINKRLNLFYKNSAAIDGLRPDCKDCSNKRNKEYYIKNIDQQRQKKAEWREKNPHYFKSWRKDNPEYDRIQKNTERSRKVRNNYAKKRKKNDPVFRIRCAISSRLWTILTKNTAKKPCTLKVALGCSVEKLKEHLECQFTEGMSWDNYGKWHVDHIIPLNSFNLIYKCDYMKANHYTNLQPLWAKENLSKGAKIKGENFYV